MRRLALPLLAALALGACATVPLGPSVLVLPGPDKPFDQFQMDDARCRQWALQQSGAAASQSPATSALAGTALGTLLGAAVGAAFGAIAGDPGLGAAVGAGMGALSGTSAGAEASSASSYELQRSFDVAYQQCMYARGNQIPGVPTRQSYHSPPPPPPPPPAPGQ